MTALSGILRSLIAVATLVGSRAVISAAEPRANKASDDWPCWRGPAGNNHSAASNPPTEWTVESNIVWTVDVPGRGHASPCISGDKVFLASADDSAETQFLVCFDRASGNQLWRVVLHQGSLPKINENNSHASATPACDGKAVYTVFANNEDLIVSAVSLDGNILWQKTVGRYQHANGYGASPVLFDRFVIVVSDNQLEPSITALNRADGYLVWRTERPKSDNSATPIIGFTGGRPQLFINGAHLVVSYDPATGEEIWRVKHGTEVAACTMAFGGERVFASGNVPEKSLLCVRADGRGDVSTTHVLWKTNDLITYVPSPLIFDQYLFTVNDSGVAWCRDAATSEVIWKERLAGRFFSSPVLAAGRIFATNDAGVTYVLRATAKFEKLAENNLDEPCMATPAICGNRIYIRTAAHLFCIGNETKR